MPKEHRGPQRLPHFRARAGRDHQRHDAENEGEAGHEDGAQAQTGRLDRRVDDALAGVLDLPGELDDEDRVFAGEPDQNDEADLREDVVVHAPQPDAPRWR